LLEITNERKKDMFNFRKWKREARHYEKLFLDEHQENKEMKLELNLLKRELTRLTLEMAEKDDEINHLKNKPIRKSVVIRKPRNEVSKKAMEAYETLKNNDLAKKSRKDK
jgi:hypothetical protein